MTDNIIQNNILSERLDDVEETLRNMDSKIEKIYDVVVGNEKFDQQGVIGRLKKLETENENNKELKNKLIGAFIVGGAGWTFILELVKMILRK